MNVLIATDSTDVAAEVASVLPESEFQTIVVDSGPDVLKVAQQTALDLVIVDLQIGNMGGFAISLDLRLEASGNRLPEIPVVLLLDRRADVFLARRANARGWVMKPLDPIRLRKAIRTVLDGGIHEDPTGAPSTVLAEFSTLAEEVV